MYPLTQELTHFPDSVGLVVEEVLTKLEQSPVSRGYQRDLGGGGEDRGGVGDRLFQDGLLESRQPGTAGVEERAIQEW